MFDAVMANTAATGNWKKNRAPKFKPYPRPGRVKPKVTNIAGLRRMVSGG